jgi:hypothetical protein
LALEGAVAEEELILAELVKVRVVDMVVDMVVEAGTELEAVEAMIKVTGVYAPKDTMLKEQLQLLTSKSYWQQYRADEH